MIKLCGLSYVLVLLLVGGGRSQQDAEAQAQAVHREQEPGD